MQLAALRPRARAPAAAPFRQNTLLVALIIVFPVIGLEQFLHTTPLELQRQPLYEGLHWLSDSLLALPLAALAVWAGNWLATRLGIGGSHVSDVFTRACLIALMLAVLLVPGEALHEQVDQLTHTHVSLGFHSHGAGNPGTGPGPPAAPAGIGHPGGRRTTLSSCSAGTGGQSITKAGAGAPATPPARASRWPKATDTALRGRPFPPARSAPPAPRQTPRRRSMSPAAAAP